MMNPRFLAGLALGMAIGFGCALTGVPAPAPPLFAGALLVVAMTSGYLLAEHRLARRPATTTDHCGGPHGR